MQNMVAIDNALERIAEKAPKMRRTPASTVELGALVKHAHRFGTEGVLYTAHQAGYEEDVLVGLAETLDNLRCQTERHAKPMNGRQLRSLVARIGEWL